VLLDQVQATAARANGWTVTQHVLRSEATFDRGLESSSLDSRREQSGSCLFRKLTIGTPGEKASPFRKAFFVPLLSSGEVARVPFASRAEMEDLNLKRDVRGAVGGRVGEARVEVRVGERAAERGKRHNLKTIPGHGEEAPDQADVERSVQRGRAADD